MSEWDTGQDIIIDVLGRAGELLGNTRDYTTAQKSDYFAAAKDYINRVYRDVLRAAPWPFAMKDPPGILNTVDKVTGTATMTEGSASVTLSATVAVSLVGYIFTIDNEQIPYRVTAHTAGTDAVTLDATYKQDSGSLAYTCFKDEYELASDCVRPWFGWFRDDPGFLLDFPGVGEMHNRWVNRQTHATVVARASIVRGSFPPTIRIAPWVEEAKTIEYEYTYMPSVLDFGGSTTDTPIIPVIDRHILADGALAFVELDKEETDKAVIADNIYQAKLAQMKRTYITPFTRPRMRPARHGQLGVS